MRQVVLDTETTGLDPRQGHRIIEIGALEIVNRRPSGRRFHQYLNPEREVEQGALAVHGINNEFLQDKPRFAEVAAAFLDFIRDAEVLIHNAPFDVGFLNHELKLLGDEWPTLEHSCRVVDTLVMARKRHPGAKNNLDALCKRYGVDNSNRDLHGALLDAQILAEVYLAMTGGQVSLYLDSHGQDEDGGGTGIRRVKAERPRLAVIAPDERELAEHQVCLQAVDKASKGECLWLKTANTPPEAESDQGIT